MDKLIQQLEEAKAKYVEKAKTNRGQGDYALAGHYRDIASGIAASIEIIKAYSPWTPADQPPWVEIKAAPHEEYKKKLADAARVLSEAFESYNVQSESGYVSIKFYDDGSGHLCGVNSDERMQFNGPEQLASILTMETKCF